MTVSTSVYFDTNTYALYYMNQQNADAIRDLVSNRSEQIFISNLTFLEFLGILLKYHRKGQIKKRVVKKIVKRLRRDLGSDCLRPFQIIEFPTEAFRQAEIILLNHGIRYGICTNDALHLAIVKLIKQKLAQPIVFATFDNSLRRVSESCGIICHSINKN